MTEWGRDPGSEECLNGRESLDMMRDCVVQRD